MSLETAFSAGTPIAASKMPITPATLRSDAATRAAPDDMVKFAEGFCRRAEPKGLGADYGHPGAVH
jgi:hypothetical protein